MRQYLGSINVAFKCSVTIYFAYEMDVHVAVIKPLSCYMHLHELHMELAKPKCKYSPSATLSGINMTRNVSSCRKSCQQNSFKIVSLLCSSKVFKIKIHRSN